MKIDASAVLVLRTITGTKDTKIGVLTTLWLERAVIQANFNSARELPAMTIDNAKERALGVVKDASAVIVPAVPDLWTSAKAIDIGEALLLPTAQEPSIVKHKR
ncbi:MULTISPECIES: hypothetical protein [unclassified Aminobacter]|uniref:hypothetical protein n=1 Tax=unclassified Aminobacter TaxID=2644704 RepID=UPI00046605C0|nr:MULTISPECIES: hypothetical protein [unclassified Aminobacter]